MGPDRHPAGSQPTGLHPGGHSVETGCAAIMLAAKLPIYKGRNDGEFELNNLNHGP
jgi:hypothetical protein